MFLKKVKSISLIFALLGPTNEERLKPPSSHPPSFCPTSPIRMGRRQAALSGNLPSQREQHTYNENKFSPGPEQQQAALTHTAQLSLPRLLPGPTHTQPFTCFPQATPSFISCSRQSITCPAPCEGSSPPTAQSCLQPSASSLWSSQKELKVQLLPGSYSSRMKQKGYPKGYKPYFWQQAAGARARCDL